MDMTAKERLSTFRDMLGSTGILAGANLASQAARLAGTLAILGMYTKEDFGIYAVFFSHVNILITVNGLGYPASIPNQSGSDVHRMVTGSILVSLLGSLIFLGAYEVAGYEHSLGLALYVFSYSAYRVFEMACLRDKAFRTMAALKLVQPGVFLLLLALIWFNGAKSVGELVWAQALSITVAAAAFIAAAKGASLFTADFQATRYLLFKERSWPLLMAPAELLSNMSFFLPVILVQAVLGSGPAGEYGLVLRLCLGPVMVIGHAGIQVFHAELSQVRRHPGRETGAHLLSRLKKPALFLLAAGAVTGLAVSLVLPRLLAALFPGKFPNAGTYAVLMGPFFGALLVVMPMESAFLAFSKLGAMFFFQAFNVIVAVTCFWYVAERFGLIWAVAAYSGLGLARLAVEAFWSARVIARSSRD